MPLMYFNVVLAACARVVNYYQRERPTVCLLPDAYRTLPTESSTGLPLFFYRVCAFHRLGGRTAHEALRLPELSVV
jgi:hypothetical protein